MTYVSIRNLSNDRIRRFIHSEHIQETLMKTSFSCPSPDSTHVLVGYVLTASSTSLFFRCINETNNVLYTSTFRLAQFFENLSEAEEWRDVLARRNEDFQPRPVWMTP